jgi:hypothetical protein
LKDKESGTKVVQGTRNKIRIHPLGTDFETHAIWQGYVEEPAAKDFVARKACIIALSKAQGTHWDVIKCKSRMGIAQKHS